MDNNHTERFIFELAEERHNKQLPSVTDKFKPWFTNPLSHRLSPTRI